MKEQLENYQPAQNTGPLQGYQYGTAEYAEAHKPWAECTVEQKLDRLRDELLGFRRHWQWEQDRLQRIDRKLQNLANHQHGHDGTVMVRERDVEPGYGLVGALEAKAAFDPLA